MSPEAETEAPGLLLMPLTPNGKTDPLPPTLTASEACARAQVSRSQPAICQQEVPGNGRLVCTTTFSRTGARRLIPSMQV